MDATPACIVVRSIAGRSRCRSSFIKAAEINHEEPEGHEEFDVFPCPRSFWGAQASSLWLLATSQKHFSRQAAGCCRQGCLRYPNPGRRFRGADRTKSVAGIDYLISASFFRSTRLIHSWSSLASCFCNSISTKYRFATMTQSVPCFWSFSYASNPGLPSMVTALL